MMAHYSFSAGLGVGYVVLTDRFPAVRRGMGTLYGAAVWATADEGLMPALQLSRGPRQLSVGMHVYSLLGHFVFGTALECVRLALDRDDSDESGDHAAVLTGNRRKPYKRTFPSAQTNRVR
jgi:uncharacterized membrane protein YagU involved in acid resistance